MTPADLAEKVADELRGTCDSLLQALERHDAENMELNHDFCARLDSLVFCCERCNWWCEISEMAETPNDDWICEDCTEDNERD